MRSVVVLALGLWVCAGLAAEGNLAVSFDAPRPFGYVIGDVITHQAVVEVDAPYQLDAASLPKPGPVNRWLWLRGIETTQTEQGQRHRYQINLHYQTFYAPMAVKNLTIPGFEVGLGGGLKAQIPAWAFSAAPIRGLAAAEENGVVALRPEAEPQAIATWTHWLRLAGFSLLALAALAHLAYSLGWLSLGQRGRHFAEAISNLRRLESQPANPDQGWLAFTAVHQAFNLTLGQALFTEGLPDFFAGNPRYQSERPEIEAFFRASYDLFFGAENDAAAAFPVGRLVKLCRACIRIEREALQVPLPEGEGFRVRGIKP